MEHQKRLNLLNEASDSTFVTKKWNIVNNESNANYDIENEIIYYTKVSKSNLCDYNDAYILVRGNIITMRCNNPTQVAIKNCAPFISCITKIDGLTTDDAENLDLVMPMYNLIECSSNYTDMIGSLWFYSGDETTVFHTDVADTSDFKLLKHKAKLLGNTVASGDNVAL